VRCGVLISDIYGEYGGVCFAVFVFAVFVEGSEGCVCVRERERGRKGGGMGRLWGSGSGWEAEGGVRE